MDTKARDGRPAVAEGGADDGERWLTELLAELPPDEPPPGFHEEIELLLGVVPARAARVGREREGAGRLRTAAHAASWAWRGPAAGLSGGGAEGVRASLAGLEALRWAFGPLGVPRGRTTTRRRPLWRRVLGG